MICPYIYKENMHLMHVLFMSYSLGKKIWKIYSLRVRVYANKWHVKQRTLANTCIRKRQFQRFMKILSLLESWKSWACCNQFYLIPFGRKQWKVHKSPKESKNVKGLQINDGEKMDSLYMVHEQSGLASYDIHWGCVSFYTYFFIQRTMFVRFLSV